MIESPFNEAELKYLDFCLWKRIRNGDPSPLDGQVVNVRHKNYHGLATFSEEDFCFYIGWEGEIDARHCEWQEVMPESVIELAARMLIPAMNKAAFWEKEALACAEQLEQLKKQSPTTDKEAL
jgi:hypothetical protein